MARSGAALVRDQCRRSTSARDRSHQGFARKSYLWTYLGDCDQPFTVFDYRDSRSRDGPTEILKSTAATCKQMHTRVMAQWSWSRGTNHSPRLLAPCPARVLHARASQPREAHYALSLIGQLYDIEDQFEGAAPKSPGRSKERSVPVLDRLKLFPDEQAANALPRSQYRQAIGYLRNQWESLRRYADDGRLAIDNNNSERTLRVAAIGRKNCLFLEVIEVAKRRRSV